MEPSQEGLVEEGAMVAAMTPREVLEWLEGGAAAPRTEGVGAIGHSEGDEHASASRPKQDDTRAAVLKLREKWRDTDLVGACGECTSMYSNAKERHELEYDRVRDELRAAATMTSVRVFWVANCRAVVVVIVRTGN